MVNFKIDGTFLLVTAAIAGGVYVYAQRNKIINSINPASRENVIFQAVDGPAFRDGADTFFSVIDILNPFNESDDFARRNLGLN